jgi:hypothetical protein
MGPRLILPRITRARILLLLLLLLLLLDNAAGHAIVEVGGDHEKHDIWVKATMFVSPNQRENPKGGVASLLSWK